MKRVQLVPRNSLFKPVSTFKPCLFKHAPLSAACKISIQTIKPLPLFTLTLTRSFTSNQQKTTPKQSNVNTNPLDVNSNLNILQGLLLAGEFTSVDNRIQKILQKGAHDKIKIDLWNLILSFYASQRNESKLDHAIKALDDSKVQRNTGTFLLLLQYYGASGKMDKIEELVKQAESTSNIDFPLIINTAIASSSNFSKMYKMVEQLKPKHHPNADTLMALIAASIKNNCISEMELAVKRFRDRGIEPNADAYIAILSVYHNNKNKARVDHYLREIKKKQLHQNQQIVKLLERLNLSIPE